MPRADHIHFDHVGSLLRPVALRDARQRILGVHDADHNVGPHDNAELRALEDEFIRDVVKLQEDSGLPFITDGEFRRRSWWTDFVMNFTGTRVTYNGNSPVTFVNSSGDKRPAPGVEVSAPIHWRGSMLVEPFKFLKSVTHRKPKVTMPAPPIIHFLRDAEFVPTVYRDMDEFWDDVVTAYRTEIRELANAGCEYLQLDECMLPLLCDPRHQEFLRARGEDPAKLIDRYAWVINQAIAERPDNMLIGIHMCRGNMNAYWGGEGGYELIADAMFNQLEVDIYLLEYDTPRAGDFKPLRFVPKGKKVLLGLISTKEKQLEASEEIERRVSEAAKHVDHGQLGLCPQCGFSTNVFGTHFTVDDERRKLERIVEVSRKLWG